MKITLYEFGGHLAGMQRPPKVVELSGVSTKDAAEWERLLAAVEAEASPQVLGPGKLRDAMGYRISLETEDGKSIELRRSDANMSQDFFELKEWISRHSK